MPHNFIPVQRDQQFLMPPDMRSWLSKDHLAWFVLETIEHMDLSSFYARYRQDGWGRAAFEPKMMVALLVYAYALGVRSSRAIERRCHEDIAFRVIAANHSPDHATIARFRVIHRSALSALFNDVLRLCIKSGLGKVGVVAIDGTKIKANASRHKSVDPDDIDAIVEQILADADAIDAEEDRLYGDKRGDELPGHLADPDSRAEALRRAKADIDAERDAEIADYEEKLAERKELIAEGHKPHGRTPMHPDDKKKKRRRRKINLTDPDSRLMKVQDGYIQGFNAQAAVSQDHIIVAADVTNDNTDVGQFRPMFDQVGANLEISGAADKIATVVADAGYFSDDNATLDTDTELLIAPVSTRNLDKTISHRHPPKTTTHQQQLVTWRAECALAEIRAARRQAVFDAYVARQVTGREAAEALSVSIATIKWNAWHYRRHGRLPDAKGSPARPRPHTKDVMLERFARPGALTLYRMRATTVEPVFGQIKELRGVRRFMQRGLEACRAEWRLVSAAHNLRKLWSSGKWDRSFAFTIRLPTFRFLSAAGL